MGTADLVQIFSERFRAAGGIAHTAESMRDAMHLAAGLLASGRRVHVAPGVSRELLPLLEARGLAVLTQCGVNDYLEDDAGITEAGHAIASTGSLVEVAPDESTRLASSATSTHIAFLRASSIIQSLSGLADLVRSELGAAGRKPAITLIGGPSRTSDIELKDVIGVHGPKEVHAVIYGG